LAVELAVSTVSLEIGRAWFSALWGLFLASAAVCIPGGSFDLVDFTR